MAEEQKDLLVLPNSPFGICLQFVFLFNCLENRLRLNLYSTSSIYGWDCFHLILCCFEFVFVCR